MTLSRQRLLASPRPLPAWRARAVWTLLGLGLGGTMLASWDAQVLRHHQLRDQGDQRYLRQLPLPLPARAPIVDRHGEVLAVSVPTTTLWADPRFFPVSGPEFSAVAQALHLSEAELRQRLHRGGSRFAYVARQLPPDAAAPVLAMKVAGLHQLLEYRRYYPDADVTGPLLGFTDLDGHGIAGIELSYDSWLRSKGSTATALQDNRGRTLAFAGLPATAKAGQTLALSIDRNLQYTAYTALAAAVQAAGASSGSAVLMDLRNGEILALVSYPSYNPNNRSDYVAKLYDNRALNHTYEPGSVMKPFAVAAALDAGSIRPDSRFDVATSCYRVGRYCIRDDVRHGTLDLRQVLQYSSNIGAAQISLRTPPAALYGTLQRAGFGRISEIGFPGEAPGNLPPSQNWDRSRQAAMAYGYGISVTTLQLAAAYGAIARDGIYLRPTLVHGGNTDEHPGPAVMRPQTAALLRQWLQAVVAPGGTGFLAAIPGYSVAGKTGTSALANGKGGFHHSRVNTSFVGFAPAEHPRLVMAVTVRDPSRGLRYGGVVAAPVFRVTMGAALRALRVPPDRPFSDGIVKVSSTQQKLWAEGAGDARH
ncbi:penicillin-binding protein 2 [Acidithiobacillus sp.]|uniref:peptidoglycan D,D-transpeptidase FtsI family protein n=1 Tax=Acidithiobacillus sp. TaxID=1872118 RepID=UPI0025BAFA36|nr:penicillin-binding protein 2 [Acidithiobacillus sp.]